MITVEDLFNNSVVISNMPSRLELLKKALLVADMPFPAVCLKGFSGNTEEEKAVACRLSHCKAIEYAKKMNWPYVLILEDDAWPRFNIKQKLEILLQQLPNDDIKIAAIGFLKADVAAARLWRKATSLDGTQSYVVFQSAYDKAINAMRTNNVPIDHIIGKCAKNLLGFSAYASEFICFTQYNSRSEDASKKLKSGEYGYYIYGKWRKDTKLKPWFHTEEQVNDEFSRRRLCLNSWHTPLIRTVYAEYV